MTYSSALKCRHFRSRRRWEEEARGQRSRMLQTFLVREGYDVGRLHVARLMKRMGVEAIYRRPNTSKPAPGHMIFPYLLRKLPVTRPNQVCAMDITYIPMAQGFVYLAAVDQFSRKVLHGSYRLRWKRSSVSRRSRRLLPDTASPKGPPVNGEVLNS
jgi:transposase InsO family protein